jgi:hypothetical protein
MIVLAGADVSTVIVPGRTLLRTDFSRGRGNRGRCPRRGDFGYDKNGYNPRRQGKRQSQDEDVALLWMECNRLRHQQPLLQFPISLIVHSFSQ